MRVRSGGPAHSISTPRTSLPRITTCSMSSTDSGYPVRTPNSLEVTPGRSGPVRVMSRVVREIFMAAPGYRKEPGYRGRAYRKDLTRDRAQAVLPRGDDPPGPATAGAGACPRTRATGT